MYWIPLAQNKITATDALILDQQAIDYDTVLQNLSIGEKEMCEWIARVSERSVIQTCDFSLRNR